jgi:SAM-dependent methyltransferase
LTDVGVEALRSTWERLGRDDPLWAIMPYPAEKSADWDVAEFMATGVADIAIVEKLLAEHGLRLSGRVLDFGCGVGRLTNAIAEQPGVREVVGVDIASSMVELATRHCRHPDRVEFQPYDGGVLPFADGSFDAVVSLVVVQHAPPQAQLRYLLELQRVVADGGVIVLQAVTAPRLPQRMPATAYRASYEVLAAPSRMHPGSSASVVVRLRNDGPHPWPADRQLRLGNHWLTAGRMTVRDDGRTDLPAELAPGEGVELQLTVTAPGEPGTYQLELDMVQERVAWWAELGSPAVQVDVEVAGPATEAGASPPDDSTRGVEMHAIPDDLLRGIFQHGGCTVLSQTADHYSDGHWDSYTYVIRAR